MNQQNRDFQAFLGHLVDLYKISLFKFAVPHSYTKFRAIKTTAQKVGAKTFIETGTYLGVTTRRCAPVFDAVYTIELDQKLADQASEFLRSKKNVEVLQGDALNVLPKILDKNVRDILVFLDGHFSGGVTACGDLPEPAIEELKILAGAKDRIAAIIIDDFRLFGTEPGFPSKSALFKALEEYFPSFRVTVSLDQILICRGNV
jgi:Ribosomal RNA adenine dimethylase